MRPPGRPAPQSGPSGSLGEDRSSPHEGTPPSDAPVCAGEAISTAAPTRALAIGANQWRALLASVAVAALGYLAFSLWGGWHDVTSAAARVGLTGLGALLLLSCTNYGLRFLRWQIFLRALGRPQPAGPSFVIYLAGFALTTTPGKVGEAVRSLFLKDRGVSHADGVAAFVSERLSDLLAVALLCSLGWNVYPPLRPLVAIGLVAIVVALVLLSQPALLRRWQGAVAARSGRLAGAARLALQLLVSAHRCHRPRVLAVATALSLAAWSAEAWALHLLLRWLDVDVSVAFAVFTYAVGMLAGALSFMPGGLGGTEATMTALLMGGGAGHSVAIAATVLIRLTTLWFAVAIGVVALMRLLPTLDRASPGAAGSSPAPPTTAAEAVRA